MMGIQCLHMAQDTSKKKKALFGLKKTRDICDEQLNNKTSSDTFVKAFTLLCVRHQKALSASKFHNQDKKVNAFHILDH